MDVKIPISVQGKVHIELPSGNLESRFNTGKAAVICPFSALFVLLFNGNIEVVNSWGLCFLNGFR